MANKKDDLEKDLPYEGRDEAFLDVDRYINEGMSGGTVHVSRGHTNIEEARELEKEQPPHCCDEE